MIPKMLRPLILVSVVLFVFQSCSSRLQDDPKARLSIPSDERVEYDYAYALGVQAVIYGWAPVMMDVARVLQTSVDAPRDNGQAPLNEFGPITRLWDYRDRSYATPNNDTLYLQGWLDIEEQPMVIFVPPIKNRYWMMQILDMYTESVVDLCNATVGDRGGYFVVAKRGYEGKFPKGVPVYYSRTRYVWLAGRLGVKNLDDEVKARKYQKQFRLMSLNEYPNGGKQPIPLTTDGAPRVDFPAGLDWFKRLDDVLAANTLDEDQAIIESLRYIGIGAGGIESLGETRKKALKVAFKDGMNIVVNAAKYSDKPVNGWNWEYKAGKYGADYLQRAAVNMNSVGLNSPERAMYPKRYVDDTGTMLHGDNAYAITLPKEMPVREEVGGFWSITMYDAVDRFMVENELRRYKVGSTTDGLVFNDDGTLTIYVSNERPSDPKALANWLPAPADEFMLQCRLYEPEESVVKGEFQLPQLKILSEKL